MKLLIKILLSLFAIYICICLYLFVNQENLIFYRTKLDANFHFDFPGRFEEINVKISDNKLLNAVLFKADSSKGVIFYLHGNAGGIKQLGGKLPKITTPGC